MRKNYVLKGGDILSVYEGPSLSTLRRKARANGLNVKKVKNWNNWIGNDGYIVTENNCVIAGSPEPLNEDELTDELIRLID